MSELIIEKNVLLPALLVMAGAIDKRQRLPILANLLIKFNHNNLILTATDLEIEITASLNCTTSATPGAITIPAKKFIDIIRSLDAPEIKIIINDANVLIKSGSGHFKLLTLPAEQFPVENYTTPDCIFKIDRLCLWQLLQSTHFAMSQQEIRVFLNSLFFEIDGNKITTVAIDGHRMAICKLHIAGSYATQQLLLPRRGVLEILRVINNIQDDTLEIMTSKKYFRITSAQYSFITKLTDANFPCYQKAITLEYDKFIQIDRDALKRALARILILANEKSRGVLMQIQPEGLTLIAHNQEQEEAQESIAALIDSPVFKIGVNANYLHEVLHYLPDGMINLSMISEDKSILVQSLRNPDYQYIIMPMKI